MDSYTGVGQNISLRPFYATQGAYFANNGVQLGNVKAVGHNLASALDTNQFLIAAGTAMINVSETLMPITFSNPFPNALISCTCTCGGEAQACYLAATSTAGFTANIPLAATGGCDVNWICTGN